jgi:hypothetical protein
MLIARPGPGLRSTAMPTSSLFLQSRTDGVLTLRHNSRLNDIRLGRRHAGAPVRDLMHDLHVRVLTSRGRPPRNVPLDMTRTTVDGPRT